MYRIAYTVVILACLLTFSACEEEEVNIPPFVPPETDRVVLIEELTGASCPNCPAGGSELNRIKDQFGDNVAIVGIHSNFLGAPRENSRYDFRSPEAQQLDEFLGLYLGKPAAAINRRIFPGEDFRAIANLGSWASRVAEELENPPTLNMFASHSFVTETRELDLEVGISGLSPLSGDLRLTVYITESGIEDLQLSQDGVIENYVRNYTLRKVLSDVSGDPLPGEITSESNIRRNFSFEMPPEDGWWVAENCSIIAFVTHHISSSEMQVLQAVEIPVVE